MISLAEEAEGQLVYSGDLVFNVGYGKDLSYSEIDQQFNPKSDQQTSLTSNGFDLKLPFNEELQAKAYADSEISTALANALNLSAQFVSADISQRFQPVAIGLTHRAMSATYEGNELLSLTQWSPHLTGHISENLWLRTDYTQSLKTVSGRPERQAGTNSLGANLSWFINGAKAYFSFGAKYDTEDAVDPEQDFNANTYQINLAKQFPFLTRDGVFKLGASYEQRSYRIGNSPIGQPREEDRTRYQAELELPLTQQLQLILNAEYADHQSNFSSADYEKYVTGAELTFSF